MSVPRIVKEGIFTRENKPKEEVTHEWSNLLQNPYPLILLAPKLGHLKDAEIAKEALEKKMPVKDIAIMKGILSKEEADELFKTEKVL